MRSSPGVMSLSLTSVDQICSARSLSDADKRLRRMYNGLWRTSNLRFLPRLLRAAAAARRASFSDSPNAKVICKVFFARTLSARGAGGSGSSLSVSVRFIVQLRKALGPLFAEKRPETRIRGSCN